MERRCFSREFKVEAVRLVRDRGVSVAQTARDLDVRDNLLRTWVKQLAADPVEAFSGYGRMKTAEAEIERLRREAEPQVGGRLHLHLDRQSMALCGCRARSLLAPHRRLVDERGHDRRACHRRAHDGGLAPATTARTAASLRSRQPVYERALPAADGRAWHPMLAQDRPHGRQDLPVARRCQGRCVRLYQQVLQSPPTAFDLGYLSPVAYEERMRLA